jgi:prepilin-type N-terminal cleavage/methylation domain-containing protein
MTDKRKAFTLVELMLVILIIGVVMALLMKAGPDVVRNIKIMQTKNFLMTLEMGCQRYKEVFGSFPPDGAESGYAGGNTRLDPYPAHRPLPDEQRRAIGALFPGLQGPKGFGWSKEEHGIAVDFGPVLESGSSHLGKALIASNLQGDVFLDAFNVPIMYLKAHTNPRTHTDHLDDLPGGTVKKRYNSWICRVPFGGQDGIGGWQGGKMYDVYEAHWKKKLTARYAPDAKGVMRYYPYNPDSFVLWSAGPDERFGYWIYDKDANGYDFIRSANKLNEGTCDDITNF